MKDVVVLAIRAVAGGLLVVVFALISEGMVVGAVALVACAAAAIPLLGKFRAGAAATLALGAWLLTAAVVAVPMMVR
jgi:hypothetical protein